MTNLCMGQDFSDELECPLCLDSWKDPVENVPCGHIYCKECGKGLSECPVCRKKIESTRAPHRTLVNMALQVTVKCVRCGWTGTREQGMNHVCSGSNAPGVSPSPAASSQNPGYAPPPKPSYPPQTPPAAPAPIPYTYQGFSQQSNYASPSSSYTIPPGWQSGAPVQSQPMNYNNTAPPPNPHQSYTQPPNNYPGYPPPGGSSGSPAGYPGYPNTSSTNYSGYPPGFQAPGGGAPPPGNGRYRVIDPSGPTPWTLYDLSQSEYDQIVSLFIFFDNDDSGSLDKNEVARLSRWLNFANSPESVQRIFNDMDYDHSGSLSLGEFLTWLRHNKPNPQALYGLTQFQYNTIMMQFHTYDTNQDGYLGPQEFARLVLNLKDVPDRPAADRLFHMIDRDRDGAINLHEFLTFRAGKA